MGSSTEAPRLSRRYRFNRNFSVFAIYVALGYTMRPLYSPREHFLGITRLRRLRSVTASARRTQIFNMLKFRTGTVMPWLLRKIPTNLAQQALPRCNRRSTGALSLRRKWDYCRLLPVLVGAQTRRSLAQPQ